MTKKDIIDLVMSTFRNVQNVEVSDVPGKVEITVLTDLTDRDALYDLRGNIGEALEPTRPAGVGYDVVLKSFSDQTIIAVPAERGPSAPTKFYATPEEVREDFDYEGDDFDYAYGDDVVASVTMASRFTAVVAELDAEAIRPLMKPDPRKPVTPTVPRLFEVVLQAKERQLSACPNCNNTAFEPNANQTSAVCRGCPLPSPVFQISKVDNWDIATSKYKCSGCGRDSQVTLAISDVNLYCGGCGRLAIHTRQGNTPSLKAAVRRAKDAVLSFRNAKVTGFSDVPFIEKAGEDVAKPKRMWSAGDQLFFTRDEANAYAAANNISTISSVGEVETFKQSWPTPDWIEKAKIPLASEFVNQTLGIYADIESAPLYPDELSDEALQEAVAQLAPQRAPLDWSQAIAAMQKRVASQYELTEEEMNSSPALQLFEMFRIKLGLDPFEMYANRQRAWNNNRIKSGDFPPGTPLDRRTGRTTKAMLRAIASYMSNSELDAFFVTGDTERYTKDLTDMAKNMHAQLKLTRDMPVRPLMPADVDPSYDYKRERSFVYIDHSFYENPPRRMR